MSCHLHIGHKLEGKVPGKKATGELKYTPMGSNKFHKPTRTKREHFVSFSFCAFDGENKHR